MSRVQQDFDRLALLDAEGWTHNNHYHDFLIRSVPKNCRNALEIGCGTGAFARSLAECTDHVFAIDLSTEMIRVARSRSANVTNVEFEMADANSWSFPLDHFDCIASIATLHHLNTVEMLKRMKGSLTVGGILILLDLFEPERNLIKLTGIRDSFLNILAMSVSGGLRLLHNGRLNPPREVQEAWDAQGKHDHYPSMKEVRKLCKEILPDARVRRHLLWRYSIVWQKPASRPGQL
ncbi:MAG TPA: class I SAM-dependent methyltransferase [Pyrinomonadaceae bacterium]|nr:class I SAM-dependent methyltransferase [Pyrinomonadaceae bacterium]